MKTTIALWSFIKRLVHFMYVLVSSTLLLLELVAKTLWFVWKLADHKLPRIPMKWVFVGLMFMYFSLTRFAGYQLEKAYEQAKTPYIGESECHQVLADVMIEKTLSESNMAEFWAEQSAKFGGK